MTAYTSPVTDTLVMCAYCAADVNPDDDDTRECQALGHFCETCYENHRDSGCSECFYWDRYDAWESSREGK